MEKAVEHNPKYGGVYRTLAMFYANFGRVEDARAMLDEGTKNWPATIKNVRWFMSNWPFKDLQVAERFAEGYVKAGLPGTPSEFYKISQQNRLSEDEIRSLFFGRKVTGTTLVKRKQWSIERSEDGRASILDGEDTDTGKSWVEDDMLCDQWDNLYEGLSDCWVIYRNPEGTPEQKDEYLGAPGYGVYPFSVVEAN